LGLRVAGLLDGQAPAKVRVTHRVTLAETARDREFFIDNLLVRIHLIVEMI